MKITKAELKRIIKEEIEATLEEGPWGLKPLGSIQGSHGREPRKDIARKPGMAPGLDAKRAAKSEAEWDQRRNDLWAHSDCSEEWPTAQGPNSTEAGKKGYTKCIEDHHALKK